MRELKIHGIYKHYKGDLYIVEDIIYHSETDEKMVAYNNAQDEFNEMFEYVLHIIQMSAAGDDPETIARPEQGGCSGDCGSCGNDDNVVDADYEVKKD